MKRIYLIIKGTIMKTKNKMSKRVLAISNLLSYNEKTGDFIWKKRGVKNFDTRFAGKVAGTVNKDGYVIICINGKMHKAHRLAVGIIKGKMPRKDRHVHHENHNRSDNRATNIEQCTPAQNSQSSFSKGRGTSKFRGVSFCTVSMKWKSRIMCRGKAFFLGLFKTQSQAALAYDKAAKRLHGRFATLNF